MERDPPWSGYDKLECLWPIFLGGGIMFAFEYATGVTVHNTFWVVLFLLPGVIWYLYLTKRFVLVLARRLRSEAHTSELQSIMRISSAVCSLTKKKTTKA